MDYAVINWDTAILYSNLKNSTNSNLDKEGFYMILTGKQKSQNECVDIKLQYIGQTYKQTIKKRALQKHIAYTKINKYLKENQGYRVLFQFGILDDFSQERISKSFFDDIEACLICKGKPLTNDYNDKKNYNGERSIAVKNTGDYYPLKEKLVCLKT